MNLATASCLLLGAATAGVICLLPAIEATAIAVYHQQPAGARSAQDAGVPE